jgi:hypothetical protein
MLLKRLECRVSKLANRGACPRPTTQGALFSCGDGHAAQVWSRGCHPTKSLYTKHCSVV